MDFDAFTSTQDPDMQVNCANPFKLRKNVTITAAVCQRLAPRANVPHLYPCVVFLTICQPFGRFESWFQGRGMLSAASLSDCPFENACKLTGSQPYTPSYDTSGRSSGSVGELRSRAGGASRAGPSSGDTLQSRVRAVYLSALKARDRQDGGVGGSVALESIDVPAGKEQCAALLVF